MFNPESLKLYFICGTTTCNGRNLLEVVEKALAGGITLFQFREKGKGALEGKEKEDLAREIQKLCKSYNVPFIVNDDVELALKLNADGVHVGQEDSDVELIREKIPDAILGLSIGDELEYKSSNLSVVDYIGVGPIFSTISKDDAGKAIGYTGLEQIRELDKSLPIVAIGGISRDKIKPIMDTGVDGVSIISAISYADDIEKEVSLMLKQFN